MGIFDRRAAFKPFEYPDAEEFKRAVQHSYWLVSEWNFVSDTHDFHVKLNPAEKSAIKNALLAISQIEVSVKRFWAKLGERLPKPEIEQVGIVFAESEVRHSDSYSHLLQVLGFNDDFDLLLQNPVIQGRVDYLSKYLRNAADNIDESYALTLTLFSIFVENVSLFSQFYVIKAFNRRRNLLKDVENVIQATMKEEAVHALFGVYLLNHIKRENPSWFNDEFYAKLERACRKAFAAESEIIGWIFELGDLPFLTKDEVLEFTRKRFNESMELIGAKPIFDLGPGTAEKFRWFDEEVHAPTVVDFFHKKSVGYTKRTKAITSGDLF